MLPVAVAGVIAAVLIALFAYVGITSAHSGGKPAETVAQRYGCGQAEMTTQTHYHTHLAIYVNGLPPTGATDPIPAQIGIQTNQTSGSSSFCWIHTHDSSGIIHIEAPFSHTPKGGFTLGDFLKVWRLSNPDVELAAGAGQKMVVYVDQKVWHGSVLNVPMKSLEQIDIEILAKDQSPETPPKYVWKAGYGA